MNKRKPCIELRPLSNKWLKDMEEHINHCVARIVSPVISEIGLRRLIGMAQRGLLADKAIRENCDNCVGNLGSTIGVNCDVDCPFAKMYGP